MALQVYNTLTRQKEPFIPLTPGEVGMYVCGPTVYDDLHLGNFRCFVVFDTVARFLEKSGYSVRKVQNFTELRSKMSEVGYVYKGGIGFVPEVKGGSA